MKGLMNLLVKSGPCDFTRLDEPKIKEHESQKRIMGPCAAAASTKKAKMVSAFTLVNKFLKTSRLLNLGAMK